jgi:hypothetical protein
LQLLPDMALLQELYHFEMETTPNGLRFEAAHGFHDDLVMALALAVRALPPAPAGQVRTSGRRVNERFLEVSAAWARRLWHLLTQPAQQAEHRTTT